MTRSKQDLTELQQELMRVLWQKGEASASEVWDALRARNCIRDYIPSRRPV